MNVNDLLRILNLESGSLFSIICIKNKLKISMKKTKIYVVALSIIAMMFLALPLATHAGMESSVYVSTDEEVFTNYAVAGQTVDLSGHFHKDVYVWGNSVTISGQVDGDVIVGGSFVRITGDIGGNLRTFGSQVEIEGTVAKNVTVAGGVVTIKENADIGWDLIIAGGMVSVNGPVHGIINAAAGNLELNSLVEQGVNAKIDKEGQFLIKDNAEIKGPVNYTWHKDAQISDGAVIEGEVNRTEPSYSGSTKDTKEIISKAFWGMKLFKFAALLLIGLILLAIFGKFSEKIADKMQEKFGLGLGIGFLVVALTPLAFIILMITIIGIPLAFLWVAALGVIFHISKVFASLFLGKLILEKLLKKKKADKYLSFLIGLVLLSIVGLIPILGWLVWSVFTLAALGSFLLVEKELLKSGK